MKLQKKDLPQLKTVADKCRYGNQSQSIITDHGIIALKDSHLQVRLYIDKELT